MLFFYSFSCLFLFDRWSLLNWSFFNCNAFENSGEAQTANTLNSKVETIVEWEHAFCNKTNGFYNGFNEFNFNNFGSLENGTDLMRLFLFALIGRSNV